MIRIIRVTKKVRRAFRVQKIKALSRGIPWELTFEQWLQIWQSSGFWYKRGRNIGQYCMARFNDKGPYAVCNVKVIGHDENSREGQIGHKMPESNKLKLKKANKGNKHTLGRKWGPRPDEVKAKISRGNFLRNWVPMRNSEWMMY